MVNYALIVGINVYPVSTKQRTLGGAVADACEFAEWALDPLGGAVKPENLYFWTHPAPSNPEPRLAKYLQGKLPDWYRLGAQGFTGPPDFSRPPGAVEIAYTGTQAIWSRAREDDDDDPSLAVFFAGHGIRAEELGVNKKQTCFVAGDFRPVDNLADGLVPCVSLRRALRRKGFSPVILYLDCCRREGSALPIKARPHFDLVSDQEPLGWAECYAATDDQLAFETTSSPTRGVFTQALMMGLKGYRVGNPATLNLNDLKSFVDDNISDRRQTPYFDSQHPSPPIVIVTGPPTHPIPTALPGPRVFPKSLAAGDVLILKDARDQIVWQSDPYVSGTANIPLPASTKGLYALRVNNDPARETLVRYPCGDFDV